MLTGELQQRSRWATTCTAIGHLGCIDFQPKIKVCLLSENEITVVCLLSNVTSTRFRRVEACRWACLVRNQQPITCISRLGHISTWFDWLALVLAYARWRLKTFLNFQSEQRTTMQFGKAWRHPIQSECFRWSTRWNRVDVTWQWNTRLPWNVMFQRCYDECQRWLIIL